MKIMRRLVAACFTLLAFSLQAEEHKSITIVQSGLLFFLQSDGLVTNIPAATAPEVLQHLQDYTSRLENRQVEYALAVEKTRFKSHDTLITLIMPGGLLYAAGKQQQHAEAKDKLLKLSQQLDDLQSDLYQIQQVASGGALASLR